MVLLLMRSLFIAGMVEKLLGERWKALTEPERATYEAMAAKDHKRYDAEIEAYQVSPSSSPIVSGTSWE